jgi:hypothetical protein
VDDSTWRQFSVNGTAPANAASVRVSAIMLNGVNSGANPQSAFFDDLALTVSGAIQDADFDNNGVVDGRDFLLWQRGAGTTSGAVNGNGDANGDGAVNAADLTIWKNLFGTAAASTSAAAVPEPLAIGLALPGLVCCACRLRRRNERRDFARR